MLDVRISDRIEPLADELVRILSTPAADPFAPEWVAVPSIGMRRWLAQRLSASLGVSLGADGVCANVAMPFPDELRRAVLAAGRVDGTRDWTADDESDSRAADPWEPERLVWPVLELLAAPVLDAGADLEPLRSLPDGVSPVGRARSIAELFDRYCRHRPDMVRSWCDGRSVDGSGAPIGADRAWQPTLFRLVAERVGVPSPPERLATALERLEDDGSALDLPERLALFGMSTLSTDVVSLLDAVGRHRDVTLLLLSSSQVAAAGVAEHVRGGSIPPVLLRRDDRTGELVRNPLSRSWGQAGREATVVLAAAAVLPHGTPGGAALARDGSASDGSAGDGSGGDGSGGDGSAGDGSGGDGPAGDGSGGDGSTGDGSGAAPTLLGRVQSDIRRDRPPDASFVLAAADRSIQVHACTGRTRQVEVLRDAVLHHLADDPSLTEGDVVVLCPRIEEFAPVIEAVLGPSADAAAPDAAAIDASAVDRGAAGRAPLLRYRITDRRLRADIPLLGVLGALLEVLSGRCTASAVSDLLATGPVRDRFGFDAEDLELLDEWVVGSSIRWGLDGPQRSTWHIPDGFRDNTWAAGLDQVLTGVAIRGDDLTLATSGVAPLLVAEGSVRAGARIAEAVRTLGEIRDRLVGATEPIGWWCAQLAASVDRMCSLPWADSWQRRRLDRVLSDLRDRSVGPDGEPSIHGLTLADVRGLVSDLLGGEPARAAFGTGAITFCSMSPLRAVPARVVCVLGLDQDALPSTPSTGDDLLVASPILGDRDPRAEARQMLLEAVLSAQDSLVITYGALHERTNLPVPPAVVLDEWWDHLSATCAADRSSVRRLLRVEHPRQGFDPRNFAAVGLGDPDGPAARRPWSFDPDAHSGAVAFRQRSRDHDPGPQLLAHTPLDPLPTDGAVGLDRLRRSTVEPVREFMTHRLGVLYRREGGAGADALPAQLDPLERHGLGEALLGARASGADTARWLRVAGARGALPPGSLRDEDVERVTTAVERIERSVEVLGVSLAPPERHDIDLTIGSHRLVGVVESCVGGDRPGPVGLHFSKTKPAQRINAVVDLLALVATDPDQDWRAVVICQLDKVTGDRADELVLVPVGDSADERRAGAEAALAGLLDLRDRSLRQPLPLFPSTSYHLASGATAKARSAWTGPPAYRGECGDQHVQAAFGDLTFDELLAVRVDGCGPERHAVGLWGLLSSAVTTEDPS